MTTQEAINHYSAECGKQPITLSPKGMKAFESMLEAYKDDALKEIREKTEIEIRGAATLRCALLHAGSQPCKDCENVITYSMEAIFGQTKKPRKKKVVSAYCALCHKWTDHLAENCKR